jgi:predicted O-linked N-acetylglucosamine transferase (SPINDLY family)/predicted SAM-dependent methyltransferase
MTQNRGDDIERSSGGWLRRMLRPAGANADAQDVQALCRQGDEAERGGRFDEAAELFRRALEQRPGDAHVRSLLAGALNKGKRAEEAEQVLQAGMAARPDHVPMLIELAAALMQQNRWEQALPHLERAVRLAPDLGEPHFGLGAIHLELGKVDDAIASFRRAHELMPDHAGVHSGLAFILNYSADYTPEQILAEHRRYGDRHGLPVGRPSPDPAWPRRLRVGYVSPDFRRHVVATFMLPIIARHDRERFEVYCYFVFEEPDRVTDGFLELADRWRHCRGTPQQIFERIREDRIDVLVDLAGHSRHNALEVFALRPAPVQVSYLGYPNTTGLRAIDYRITDAKADPPGAEAHHVEKLVRLPRSFVCFRPGPGMEVGPLPALQGAPFTFGSFNNILKVSPPFIRAAAQVLKSVPGSRLLLKDKRLASLATRRRFEDAFARSGIDPARLLLRGWEPTSESHLKTYDVVDVALDTFPYNGTTTTCEALWMGVPVVSLRGERHAGRVGASLLESIGLSDCLARSEEEYVSIAAGLASDLGRLAQLRAGIRARLQASPVMDEHGFVRELEQCYLDMWSEKRAEVAAPEASQDASLRTEIAAAREAGRTPEAIEACARLLRQSPADPAALEALWDLCHDAGEHAVAIEHLGAALSARPDSPRLHYMLGCTLQDAGRDQEAAASFRRVLELEPAHAKAANNLGGLLETAGDREGAMARYDAAIRADPGLAVALANRGNLHRLAGRFAEGERDLAEAVRIDPSHADWHDALGECLARQERLDEAEKAQRAGIAAEPGSHKAHFGLGVTLQRLGRPTEAEASFRRALELAPDFSEAHSALLLALHYTRGDDVAAMFREHEGFAARQAFAIVPLLEWPGVEGGGERRIRVGYVTPDLHDRSVAAFVTPLLAEHDRQRFQVFCYSIAARPCAPADKLRGLVDEWRDIGSLSELQASRQIREDGIDILVDLAGHGAECRPLLFAHKPAPVQVSLPGYPNTTGLGQMDYRLTDEQADPPGEPDRFSTEKLVRLPNGCLCYAPETDAPRPGAPPLLKRAEVTFACVSELSRVSEDCVRLWARVLAAVPGSRLLLKAHAFAAESARRAILERFARHDLDGDRVKLAIPEASLSRFADADIALDTFPYNGTTATCDALYMGVPVVTLAGRAHASRMGASLLYRVGLNDLVAHDEDAFVECARRLAGDRERIVTLRATLRERMQASPLMDARRFARDVEAALVGMRERWRAGKGAATAGAEGALRLNIGGREAKPGWKILNAQPGEGVDFVGDCADLQRFADGSVEEIYASHVLEHLGYRAHLPRALKEFWRVLKAGGAARISVPDFEVLCRQFLDPRGSFEERLHCMRMAFGGQADEFDFHRVGLTHELLTHYLYAAGFSRVERVKRFGLFKDDSELVARGELISLNVVAYK